MPEIPIVGCGSENAPNVMVGYAAVQAAAWALEAYCTDVERVAAPVIPRPTSAPLSFGTRRARMAGPGAMSVAQVQNVHTNTTGDQLLLVRLRSRATHAALVER